MYEVTVTTTIAAAHHLRGYKGKCENVHGHNYKIEATVRTEKLDDTGLAVDFGILKEHLYKITQRFDHTDLNERPEFKEVNPSSENIARIIYQELKQSMQDIPVEMSSVKVWESEGSFVTYRE
jgi:6-pyruvoyltetrahydropterin/6-carboxytetrahydropterin synthase